MRLPRPEDVFSAIDKANKVVDKGLSLIDQIANGLDKAAQFGPETHERTPEPVSVKEGAKEGAACSLHREEHFHQAAGSLAEAMRFARTEGMRHPEVVKRISHARQELLTLEHYDLSPAEIERLCPEDRELAEWALPRSRKIRHLIKEAIESRRGIEELQKAAAEAERTAQEFTARVLGSPEKECEPCGQMEDLKAFMERRRKERR